MKNLTTITLILILSFLFLPCYSYSGCDDGDCVNGQGTFTYYLGEKYVGEFKDGMKNGRGVEIYPDGSRITGRWILGEYVGE